VTIFNVEAGINSLSAFTEYSAAPSADLTRTLQRLDARVGLARIESMSRRSWTRGSPRAGVAGLGLGWQAASRSRRNVVHAFRRA
jgi:hypothetical protein